MVKYFHSEFTIGIKFCVELFDPYNSRFLFLYNWDATIKRSLCQLSHTVTICLVLETPYGIFDSTIVMNASSIDNSEGKNAPQ